ncbi:hypothetical protein NQ317_004607, partial [Molorchus minor]
PCKQQPTPRHSAWTLFDCRPVYELYPGSSGEKSPKHRHKGPSKRPEMAILAGQTLLSQEEKAQEEKDVFNPEAENREQSLKAAERQTLREMWKEYMRQNLGLARAPSCLDQDWTSFSAIAAKSELVGAEIKVVKSKVPNQIGMSGTVVLETKMTFQIVTPQSKLKILVKDSSVFEFCLDDMRFTVYGKHIATRPSERSTKKIKTLMIPDL